MHVAFDLETELIQVGHMAPKPVCGIFTTAQGNTELWATCEDEFLEWIDHLLMPGVYNRTANGAYDWGCILAHYPQFAARIFQMYDEGRVHDVQIMARLADLSFDGKLSEDKSRYSLDHLGTKLGWRSRTAQKKGDDVWRLRYSELMGMPAKEYPTEAREYAMEDGEETWFVYERILQVVADRELSLVTHEFHAKAAFALFLITCQGFWTDRARVRKLDARLEELLSPENWAILYEEGLISPAVPSRRYKNGSGWTKPRKEVKKLKVVRGLIESLYEQKDIAPPRTDPSDKFPEGQVRTDKDAREQVVGISPALDAYHERATYATLRDTFVEPLRGGIVYFGFNCLVSTGRSSSSGSSLVPSMNGQNIPRVSGELSIRECMVPRPGKMFGTIDYSSLELCTLAWTCKRLFGFSVLYDKINEGVDPHAYLGAQICWMWFEPFQRLCAKHGLTTPDEKYAAFMEFKAVDKTTWKQNRTVGKVTGLAYPGGMGPATFITYARSMNSEVQVTFSQASQLRDLWHLLYPEMRLYFERLNDRKQDHRNRDKYWYTSPMGMVRRGATYCAAANGEALQTPSAEGAKTAVWDVVRAQLDPSMDSVLYGTRSLNFVHDEMILELNEATAHEEVTEASRLMVDAMTSLYPGIRIVAEPALMDRWYKDAEPVHDSNGRLVPWRPTPQTA